MRAQFFALIDQIQKIGSLACRLLQRVLVILIFILFFVFAKAYLEFLFITPYHHQQIDNWVKIVYLMVGLFFFYNLVYNYVMSYMVGPGLAETLPAALLITHNVNKRCRKCSLPKPVRTHHCSICNKCILQMDHHCPWMGVCIGHENRRYFIRFLLYLALSCFLVVTLCVRLNLPKAEVFTFMLTIGIVISVFGSYHWWIVLRGKTTLEFCQILDGYKPSKSFCTNFLIVFGTTNFLLAMLPIYIPLVYKGCQWNEVPNHDLNTLQLDQSQLVPSRSVS